MVEALTPTEIENILHRGAQRRGRTPELFRAVIEQIATECRVPFALLLRIVSQYDKDPAEWQKFIAEYRLAAEEAARMGCSLPQLMKVYLRLNDQPDQKHLIH
jgi:hypothetical protein